MPYPVAAVRGKNFGTPGLAYLLRDEFTDTLTAGNVNGTAATPGPGTRAVVDTGSELSLSGGDMVFGGITGEADPGMRYGAITRVAGIPLILEFTAGGTGHRTNIGWDANQAGAAAEATFYTRASGVVRIDAAGGVITGAFSAATSYQVALVLRASGAFYLIKGGAYTTWTLLWSKVTENAATIYPANVAGTVFGTSYTSSYMKVPDALWLPTPLVSDGFTDDNTTRLDAHATDGLGHAEGVTGGIGEGGNGLSWTHRVGTFQIQSNHVEVNSDADDDQATVTSSAADIIVDCDLTPSGANPDYDSPGLLLRWLDSTHFWLLYLDVIADKISIYENNAGYTERANAGVTINGGNTYAARVITYGKTIDIYVDGGNKATYGSAALNETATIHGIRHKKNGTGGPGEPEWDNFTIYSRDGFSALDAY